MGCEGWALSLVCVGPVPDLEKTFFLVLLLEETIVEGERLIVFNGKFQKINDFIFFQLFSGYNF